MTYRVVVINGSPQPDGSCAHFAQTLVGGGSLPPRVSAQPTQSPPRGDTSPQQTAPHVTTQLYSVAHDSFRPCRGCQTCLRTKRCVITDDDVASLLTALAKADELIWIAPMYFGAPPAQLKALIDRFMVLWAQNNDGQGGIPAQRDRPARAYLTAGSDDPVTEAMLTPLRYASNTAGFTLKETHVFPPRHPA